jgi:hypothetical protein
MNATRPSLSKATGRCHELLIHLAALGFDPTSTAVHWGA